jgi:predicted MPP superfamily phosphohydrolase
VIPNSDRGTPRALTRRRFLEQTALLVSATPFAAIGYGLLYGRLDVEVVRRRIRLARLPRAFDGFQIAQLSDIHLGPFASADYIRRCVAITNDLKPDLIALTGDYISWDPEAQHDAVDALAGLDAPHGAFACLGNHEEESNTEESTTRSLAAAGIRVLRQERTPILLRGEMLSLAGIDTPRGDSHAPYVRDMARRLEGLADPATVNVLLSHYPDVLDRAAESGFDLILAGHTHGGQLSLDFIRRGQSQQLHLQLQQRWQEKNARSSTSTAGSAPPAHRSGPARPGSRYSSWFGPDTSADDGSG